MMARALVAAGAARVYIVGRRVDVLQEAANSINRPSVVVPLYCDVTSKVSLESVVSVVETDVGHLDLLVCNAGIGGPQAKPPVKGVTSLEEWWGTLFFLIFLEYSTLFSLFSCRPLSGSTSQRLSRLFQQFISLPSAVEMSDFVAQARRTDGSACRRLRENV